MNLRGKKIILTGATGFLGQHIKSELLAQGCEILLPFYRETGRRNFFDLREQKNVRTFFRECSGADIVIHAAAHAGGIGLNQAKPGELFYDNAIMGIMLMEEARRAGVKKFVQLGTICAYPKLTPVPFEEKNLWEGYPEDTNAPYGLAKKMLLVQAQAYRAQYGFNAIYLLPVNMYGPHDNFDAQSSHVIPALIRKFVEANRENRPTVELWGTGRATREFLYVEDCARAVVLATQRYNGPNPVNLGVGSEISIRELAEKIANILDYPGQISYNGTVDGQPRRCLDTRRAHAEFDFKAATDLDTGLRKTIDWYLQNEVK